MIEVHHLNNSRSQRVLWLLEELGLPYTIIFYERDATTNLAPASLKGIHPLGKSPVIRDEQRVIAESGVIMEYLAEKYGSGKFTPPRNTQAFERYRYFMHYAEGSFMTPMLLKLYLGRAGEGAKPVLVRVDSQIHMHLQFVEDQLGAAAYLTGDDLTVADMNMSFPLEVAVAQRTLGDQYPRLKQMLVRMHARPAYQRALEKGGPYAYAKD
jgi:glutathione S-transferase